MKCESSGAKTPIGHNQTEFWTIVIVQRCNREIVSEYSVQSEQSRASFRDHQSHDCATAICHTRERFMCNWFFFFYAKYGDAGLILLFINNFSVLRSRPSISCVWKCNVCQRFRSIKYFELVSFGVCYCWPSINWSHCDDCFQLDNEKKKKNRKT